MFFRKQVDSGFDSLIQSSDDSETADGSGRKSNGMEIPKQIAVQRLQVQIHTPSPLQVDPNADL